MEGSAASALYRHGAEGLDKEVAQSQDLRQTASDFFFSGALLYVSPFMWLYCI